MKIPGAIIFLLGFSFSVFAQENESVDMLNSQIQQLKRDMISLGSDMYAFEQNVLYPDAERFELFLSVDVGRFFELKKLQVKLEGNIIFQQAFSEIETGALEKGAAKRLYINSLKPGKYTLVAYFEGEGPRGRSYKRAVRKAFVKGERASEFELTVRDNVKRLQPEFLVREL